MLHRKFAETTPCTTSEGNIATDEQQDQDQNQDKDQQQQEQEQQQQQPQEEQQQEEQQQQQQQSPVEEESPEPESENTSGSNTNNEPTIEETADKIDDVDKSQLPVKAYEEEEQPCVEPATSHQAVVSCSDEDEDDEDDDDEEEEEETPVVESVMSPPAASTEPNCLDPLPASEQNLQELQNTTIKSPANQLESEDEKDDDDLSKPDNEHLVKQPTCNNQSDEEDGDDEDDDDEEEDGDSSSAEEEDTNRSDIELEPYTQPNAIVSDIDDSPAPLTPPVRTPSPEEESPISSPPCPSPAEGITSLNQKKIDMETLGDADESDDESDDEDDDDDEDDEDDEDEEEKGIEEISKEKPKSPVTPVKRQIDDDDEDEEEEEDLDESEPEAEGPLPLSVTAPQSSSPVAAEDTPGIREDELSHDSIDDDNSPDADIPSDDNFQDFSSDNNTVQGPLNGPQNFDVLAKELHKNFEIENNTTGDLGNDQQLPAQQENLNMNSLEAPPSAASGASQNQSCNNVGGVFTPTPSNTINNVPNTNLSNGGFGAVDIDVTQLGLESPTSISSNEMPVSSVETTPTPNFPDCAQVQSFCNNSGPGRFMDTVNSPQPVSSTGSYMPPNTTVNYCHSVTTYTAPSVLLPQNTQRLSHTSPPCSLQHARQSPNYQTNASCSLAKLQQLTNGIMEIVPENTMTPPPNLTPPPVNMTPPPTMVRNMATPPIPTLQPQMNQQYKQFQRRPSNVRKSPNVPNVTVNPNMTFSPNVTIPQPGMIARYNVINGYRMQQSMINPGYISNPSFINQSQLPVQMSVVNMHANQPFQQQIQPSQSNNPVYTTYGYLNAGLSAPALNMNMRR